MPCIISTMTHSTIAYAVYVGFQFMYIPRTTYVVVMKHICRHLKGILTEGNHIWLLLLYLWQLLISMPIGLDASMNVGPLDPIII